MIDPNGEPACWSWPIPTQRSREEEISRRLAEQPDYTREMVALILDGDPSTGRMGEFHQRRCAICGERQPDGHLVEDHCHATGQVRGWLCRSCNVREGASSLPVFIRYRRLHPAALLDVHEPYTGLHWNEGWSVMLEGLRAYELGPRPPTSWPTWSRDAPIGKGADGT